MDKHDGRTDFDFIVGKWAIHHRRLRERLAGSESWEEFDGTSEARLILDGIGNVDELWAERESGPLRGFTVRLFDPKMAEWRIYWGSGAGGPLDVPMAGRFDRGRGEFYAQDTHEGRHVYCRFIWSDITANAARWEQALSEDGGRTWEVNWIMEFTRRE